MTNGYGPTFSRDTDLELYDRLPSHVKRLVGSLPFNLSASQVHRFRRNYDWDEVVSVVSQLSAAERDNQLNQLYHRWCTGRHPDFGKPTCEPVVNIRVLTRPKR